MQTEADEGQEARGLDAAGRPKDRWVTKERVCACHLPYTCGSAAMSTFDSNPNEDSHPSLDNVVPAPDINSFIK